RWSGGGSVTAWLPNGAVVQEVVSDTGGHTAEAAVSGARTNPIPKDGGNTLHFQLFGNFTNHGLQANNITPHLAAQGVISQKAYDEIWEINPMLGGPIVKDKIWFFGDFRYSVNNVIAPGAFYNLSTTYRAYVPDTSRPVVAEQTRHWEDLRLTWQ